MNKAQLENTVIRKNRAHFHRQTDSNNPLMMSLPAEKEREDENLFTIQTN